MYQNALICLFQHLGRGYYSDVYVGMLSLPIGEMPVAVKTLQKRTSAVNARKHNSILRLQRRALKDELQIFAHLQSNSIDEHENVLKLIGVVTAAKADFCLLTEYCELGSMDHFLQRKWTNDEFEDELVFKGSKHKFIWKV